MTPDHGWHRTPLLCGQPKFRVAHHRTQEVRDQTALLFGQLDPTLLQAGGQREAGEVRAAVPFVRFELGEGSDVLAHLAALAEGDTDSRFLKAELVDLGL